jgi:hypothetical protein
VCTLPFHSCQEMKSLSWQVIEAIEAHLQRRTFLGFPFKPDDREKFLREHTDDSAALTLEPRQTIGRKQRILWPEL